MINDRIYDIAFAYRKEELWKKIASNEIFALKFSDGETGYVAIATDDSLAGFVLYIGDKAFRDFVHIATYVPSEGESLFSLRELYFRQECFYVNFTGREALTERELAAVENYIDGNDVKLNEQYAYPQIQKKGAYCMPWDVLAEKEENYIVEALDFAISLSRQLSSNTAAELGITPFNPASDSITRFELLDDEYKAMVYTPAPYQPVVNPKPSAPDDILLESVKKGKLREPVECEIVYYDVTVQESEEIAPKLPAGVLAVGGNSGNPLESDAVKSYYNTPELLLGNFARGLKDAGVFPTEFIARDQRTLDFVQDLADRLGIKACVGEEFVFLPDLENEFLNLSSALEDGDELINPDASLDENVEKLLTMMENMADEALADMPEEIKSSFEIMAGSDDVAPELRKRVNDLLSRQKGL